jgi:hypothetical protein
MELAMPDDVYGIEFPDWDVLTPAQRSALTSALVRRAHAARSRAMGNALLGAIGALFGRPARALASAAKPASARRSVSPG